MTSRPKPRRAAVQRAKSARLHSRLRRISVVAALLIAVCVAYAPALRAPFIFDDAPSIQTNLSIRRLVPPGQALHPPAGSLAVSGRPVVNYSLALNYAANRLLGVDQRADPFGPNKTVGYHIVNVLLHIACGALIFALMRLTIRDGPFVPDWKAIPDELAVAVAAIWLLHPIQTEAVNYIVQRTELLVSLCYMATLYAAARAWRSPTRSRAVAWRCCAIVACTLGMGSKEVMITAPIVVILYDRAFRLMSWRDLVRLDGDRRWFYPLLVSTSLWSIALIASAPRGGTVGFNLGLPWYEYLYSQTWAIAHYLRLFIWPDQLTLDYGDTPIRDLRGLPGLILLAVVGVLTLVAWTRANRWGWAAFLGTFFFFILAPSSSFVPIASEIAAERRIYLALAAVIVFVVVGAERSSQRFVQSALARRVATCAFATICLALVAATNRRSAAYAKPEVLWREVVERQPENPRGYNGLAQSLLVHEPPRVAEAAPLLRRALALDSAQLPALRNLAAVDIAAGKLDEAKVLLERELAVDSTYIDGRVRLGMVLVALGDPQRAAPYLADPPIDLLADADPTGKTLIALGTTLSALGHWSDATVAYRRALELTDDRTKVEEFLGDALLQQNRASEAIAPLEDAVRRAPTTFGVSLLSLAYAKLGRLDDALRLATPVIQTDVDDPTAYDIAGRAMLIAHRPAEAETLFRRALALDRSDPAARAGLSALESRQTPR